MDPATQSSGASSQIQSQLAQAGSGDGKIGGVANAVFNINGVNLFATTAAAGKSMSLNLTGSFLGSMNMNTMMGGSKLDKSPLGHMITKGAKPLGKTDLSVAASGPSLPTPQAPGGSGQALGA